MLDELKNTENIKKFLAMYFNTDNDIDKEIVAKNFKKVFKMDIRLFV